MPDMLVPLYDLPDQSQSLATLQNQGISIRRALAPERHIVLEFVSRLFQASWPSETAVTFGKTPVTCVIAVQANEILGFACYDAIAPNFFGPTGVDPTRRGNGIGKALLIATLRHQREQGYGYSIIGGAGPTEFYEKAVNAKVIEGSDPGIYDGMLRDQ